MKQIIQGGMMMILGFAFLVFRPQIKDWTGTIESAERYLGPGGTWTLFILIGVGLFVCGLLWATGTFQSVLLGTFGAII